MKRQNGGARLQSSWDGLKEHGDGCYRGTNGQAVSMSIRLGDPARWGDEGNLRRGGLGEGFFVVILVAEASKSKGVLACFY